MKFTRLFAFLLFHCSIAFSQTQLPDPSPSRQGNFYFYWGWNWEAYSRSNISFEGPNYQFTLKKVIAKDRQSHFSLKTYFHPGLATIPQFNFRIGYFIKEHYSLSLGTDHMKYVMQSDQVVKISGTINDPETIYQGTYNEEDIAITEDLLLFEHTDGLNYINVEWRRFDKILALHKIKVNFTGGLGMGILLPKTNATLLGRERSDEYHLAGYGLSGVVGLNVAIFRFFFVQTEYKGGFINLPDIRITHSDLDRAHQNFFFSQVNLVFGATLPL